MKKIIKTIALLIPISLSSCFLTDAANDVSETVALKDVAMTTDTILLKLNIPTVQDGKTFEDMRTENESLYGNPENYEIILTHVLQADNSKDGSKDADFDGAHIDVKVDTTSSESVRINNDGFRVKAGEVIKDSSNTAINAASHRITCRYIFDNISKSADIKGNVSGTVLWVLGSLNGDIPIGSYTFAIKSDADDKTRTFLGQVVASGLFDK